MNVLNVLSHLSCVWLFATPWTVAHQAPLSMGFSGQEYWSGWPCPPPGDLSDPGIKSAPLPSPALAGGFFTTSATWEAQMYLCEIKLNWERLAFRKQRWYSIVVKSMGMGVMVKSWTHSTLAVWLWISIQTPWFSVSTSEKKRMIIKAIIIFNI